MEDVTKLLSVSLDPEIILWDLHKNWRALDYQPTHHGGIWDACFIHEDKILAALSWDSILSTYDLWENIKKLTEIKTNMFRGYCILALGEDKVAVAG